MKKPLTKTLLLFVLLALGVPPASAVGRKDLGSSTLAQVVRVRGSVTWRTRDGRSVPLRIRDELTKGDHVIVRSGGEVTLHFFAGNSQYQLSENSRARIDHYGPTTLSGPTPKRVTSRLGTLGLRKRR